LPRQVSFADALENPRRLALLLEGLRRAQPELLALGVEDRLHVPYRLPLIAGGAQALQAARAAGAWLATISGSGSGLIALGPRSASARIAEALRAEPARRWSSPCSARRPCAHYERAPDSSSARSGRALLGPGPAVPVAVDQRLC